MRKVSIVIPALNEQEAIKQVISAIPRDELKRMGFDTQILVVDNGSDDGTGSLAREAGADVVAEPERGYGRAYKTGFAHATGEIIATVDADATYPVEDIPRLIKIMEDEDLDFVTTNRFAILEKGAMSFQNRVGNKILALATRILFGLNMKDPESGMWSLRKNTLDGTKLGSDCWPFSHELKIEACYFNKCHWKEVPIRYRPRSGKTKLLNGWKVGFTDLFHLIKKRIVR